MTFAKEQTTERVWGRRLYNRYPGYIYRSIKWQSTWLARFTQWPIVASDTYLLCRLCHSISGSRITLDRSLTYRNHCLKTRKTLLQKQPPQEAAWYELGRVPPHHEDDGDSTMSLCGGVLLSCLGPFHASQARWHNVKWDMPSHNRMHPPNCYSRPLRAVRHRPTRNTAQRSLPERAHQTTDRPATQPPSSPACGKPLTLAQ